jgi:ribosomal protein L29
MLLTEKYLSGVNNLRMPQPDRLQKVKKSMAAIRHVLGERKRAKIAAYHALQNSDNNDNNSVS